LIGVEIINEETTQTLVDATYHYNDKGYRVSKTVNAVTTNYLLDGDKVLKRQKQTTYIQGIRWQNHAV